MNSKKILVGTLSLGMAFATLQSCKDSKTKPAESTEKTADAKCGEGKCGDSTKVGDAKCGDKMSDSSATAKSTEAKCGDKK